MVGALLQFGDARDQTLIFSYLYVVMFLPLSLGALFNVLKFCLLLVNMMFTVDLYLSAKV